MVFNNNLLLGSSGTTTAFEVDNSTVLDDGSSQYFTRTQGTPTTEQTWTLSFWIKLGTLGHQRTVIGFDSNDDGWLYFGSDDTLAIQSSAGANIFKTTQVFRDPHAWQHIVISNSTSSVARLYINGSEVTSFATDSRSGKTWTKINVSGATFNIGRRQSSPSGNYADCYFSEFVFVDGQQLDETSFGETDNNGVWRPISISNSISDFGNNGFYLPFTDSSFLGLDNSATTNSPGALPSLLMHFDGTDGSTTMTDNSPYSQSCTAQDNAQIDTAQSKFGGASLLLDGTNDRVSVADDSSLDIGSNNFTLAGWVRFNGSPSGDATFIAKWRLAAGQREFRFYYENASSELRMVLSTTGSNEVTIAESWSPSGDTWYHLAASRTGGNIHLFVNGTQLGSGTSDSSTVNDAGHAVTFGCTDNAGPVAALNGWLDEWIFLNGTGIYSSNFTPPTAAYAINNSFVDTNSPTQSNDSPTKNYCVLTPLEYGGSGGVATYSEGNLKVVQSSGSALNVYGSVGFSSGKWHYEVTLTNTVDQFGLGIIPVGNVTDGNSNQFWNNGIGAMISGSNDGKVYNNGSQVATITSGSGTDGQTFSMEIDLDNDQLEWFNNSGSSLGTYSFTQATANGGRYLPCIHCNDDGTLVANFGASTFSKTPSTGFSGISALLLSEQISLGIEDGTAHFQPTKYAGNGTAIGSGGKEVNQSGNSSFKPDFVWIKNRDQADNHMLYDAVRGATKDLHSNSNAAQNTDTEGLSTFDVNGFTVGNNVEVNTNTEDYIAWQWKGDGTSGSTNSDGSINSTVNVNTTAGFAVGEYTTPSETAAVRTVGHGLGSNIDMLLLKNQGTGHWAVWHNEIGNEYLRLNSTDGSTSAGTGDNSLWNSVTPGNASDTFTIGTNSDVNGNNVTFTFYAFRAIEGHSAFGSYVGNASSDGPTLVDLGFKPAYVIIKQKSTTGDWISKTTVIDPQNPLNNRLYLNSANAESSSDYIIDVLSNGFKVKDSQAAINGSGNTLVYAAWAEYPFAGTTPAPAH